LEKALALVLALLKLPSFELYHNNLTPKHSLQFKSLSLFGLDTKIVYTGATRKQTKLSELLSERREMELRQIDMIVPGSLTNCRIIY